MLFKANSELGLTCQSASDQSVCQFQISATLKCHNNIILQHFETLQYFQRPSNIINHARCIPSAFRIRGSYLLSHGFPGSMAVL